jgi:hypothetical protein
VWNAPATKTQPGKLKSASAEPFLAATPGPTQTPNSRARGQRDSSWKAKAKAKASGA